ncbi:porin family protein [Dysgonomonas sp. BGC7]|uniref:porin family protein n=1 Tax=Dysgonomonas sp. BGC7 TaxID=1658008 RepID=UPI0006829462|nr:porin family protein [Dysgonomonas sp. BGC7]MBD8389572.1 PorT family protein [Dysgonomonas sp. BGC7]
MKNLMKYIMTAAIALVSLGAIAQNGHEISVYAGGGIGGLNPKSTNIFTIDKKNKAGTNFGIGYAYNFTESLALVSGIDFTMYKSEFELEGFDGNYFTKDAEEDRVKFMYDGKGYHESLKATYLNIPIMVRYSYHIDKSWGLYVSAGAKIGFRMSAKYNNTLQSLSTKGAYVQWGEGTDIPVIEDLPEQGFGEFSNLSSDGSLKLKTRISAAAELGARYAIGEKYAVYLGGYIDYTLNNIRGDEADSFMKYNQSNPSEIILNSLVGSFHKRNMESKEFLNKLRPISIGLKVQFAFYL